MGVDGMTLEFLSPVFMLRSLNPRPKEQARPFPRFPALSWDPGKRNVFEVFRRDSWAPDQVRGTSVVYLEAFVRPDARDEWDRLDTPADDGGGFNWNV